MVHAAARTRADVWRYLFSDFPVDDLDAANAWLADESNLDFREWEDASLDNQKKWAELETALSAVTGLKSHSIMNVGITASWAAYFGAPTSSPTS
jgi:hypothetical protein